MGPISWLGKSEGQWESRLIGKLMMFLIQGPAVVMIVSLLTRPRWFDLGVPRDPCCIVSVRLGISLEHARFPSSSPLFSCAFSLLRCGGFWFFGRSAASSSEYFLHFALSCLPKYTPLFFSSLGQRSLLSLSLNTITTENLTVTAHQCRLQKTESQVREQGKASTTYGNLWCIDCSAVRRSQLRQVILNCTCYVAYDACCRRPWLGFGRGGAPSIVIAIIFVEKLVRSGGILLVTNFSKGNRYDVWKVFAHRFLSFFHDQIIAEIVFRMNNFEWKVPRQNGHSSAHWHGSFQPIRVGILAEIVEFVMGKGLYPS